MLLEAAAALLRLEHLLHDQAVYTIVHSTGPPIDDQEHDRVGQGEDRCQKRKVGFHSGRCGARGATGVLRCDQ